MNIFKKSARLEFAGSMTADLRIAEERGLVKLSKAFLTQRFAFKSSLIVALLLPVSTSAQEVSCEPGFSMPVFSLSNSAQNYAVDANIPASSATNVSGTARAVSLNFNNVVNLDTRDGDITGDYEIASGFFSNYLTEPRPPIVSATDGDFNQMVYVNWILEDAQTGPPINNQTSADNDLPTTLTLFRNGQTLATGIPATQTDYQDFQVFPGTEYEYSVVVNNDMGSSHQIGDEGFLNPNGMITGTVLTSTGNKVKDAKVTLTPNMGKSVLFDGNEYMYFFDETIHTYRQFDAFKDSYTIETWFRSVYQEEQVIFSALDSATMNQHISLELTADGKIKWSHKPEGTSSVDIISNSIHSGDGHDWYHLAVSYDKDNQKMTMYIDGMLAGNALNVSPINDKAEISLGKRTLEVNAGAGLNNYFKGRLDDLRIWNIVRNWDDLRVFSDITITGREEGLKAYWKFDEVDGETFFDMSQHNTGTVVAPIWTANNLHGIGCNLLRDDYFSPVKVGALSDVNGDYVIQGIYYGGGTVFTATPTKKSAIGRSLEFDGTDDYIDFQAERIDLRNGYTMEGWFKSSSSADQVLFTAEEPGDHSIEISIQLVAGKVKAQMGTVSIQTSNDYIDNLWHHFALSSTNDDFARLYVDGVFIDAQSLSPGDRVTTLSSPVIGREKPGTASKYFNGRLDEFRLWNSHRTAEQITATMNQVLPDNQPGMANYWRFNEGMNRIITDAKGSVFGILTVGDGANTDAESVEIEANWNKDIPLNEYFDHWFGPESRNVALSLSNTVVGNIDFTDASLIPISGYVRYENTACFQKDVEILVNGQSLMPPIKTDDNGKFIVELEPGSVGKQLSAVYYTPGADPQSQGPQHIITPAIIELPMVTMPITGLFFEDKTTRTVTGVVAGGSCEFPIPPSAGVVEVTLSSVSGCFVKKDTIDYTSGDQKSFEIKDVPPLEYNITATHPDPNIEFVGDTLTLVKTDRSRNFIYRAPLIAEVIPNPSDQLSDCADFDFKLVEKQQTKDWKFRAYELYGGNKCAIDTFSYTIIDNITMPTSQPSGTIGPNMKDGEGNVFMDPNTKAIPMAITPTRVNILNGGEHPYQLNWQVSITDTMDRTASQEIWAFIEGSQAMDGNSAVISLAQEPWYVLRVPPGDESSTTFTTEQAKCTNTSFSFGAGVDAGLEHHLKMGVGMTLAAGFGAMVITELKTKVDINESLNIAYNHNTNTSKTECLTCEQNYTVSGDGLITGSDATVFIGGSRVLSMGQVNKIELVNNCEPRLSTNTSINGEGVEAIFMHSKFYIENTLIPNLDLLIATTSDNSQQNQFIKDRENWKDMLINDSIAVATATPHDAWSFGDEQDMNSISFDAGVTYEFSSTTDETNTNTYTNSIDEVYNLEGSWGTYMNESTGAGFSISTEISANQTWEHGDENTKAQTVNFSVGDGDPGDGFAFSVLRDPRWNMPVFNLIAGQSSCPYEPGTLKRQLAQLTASPTQRINVPPNEPAVFNMMIGNLSESAEDQYYTLSVLSETNPYGAQVWMNGVNLAQDMDLFVEAGQQIPMTLEIFRGPVEYDYTDIELILGPPCEFDINSNLSSPDVVNSSHVKLSVNFERPCTEVSITSPESGWLVDGGFRGDTMNVTVSGYDWPLPPNLTELELQYRMGGLGEWFRASIIPRAQIADSYILMPFNVNQNVRNDGNYELRAIATCSGGVYPGMSSVVSGSIDRTAPMVLGLPEPIDGILGPDDLIRVTFNENVDCEAINPATDIRLINTVTGNPMDYVFTCGENVITFEPNVENRFIENNTFRAEIINLRDMSGNRRPQGNESNVEDNIVWEFFVDRNPITWQGTNVTDIAIMLDEEFSTSRPIANVGGGNRSWSIIGGRDNGLPSGNPTLLPDWLNVAPTEGTLTPGTSQDVTISLEPGLNFGDYTTTFFAAGTQGDEPMKVNIRKLCYPPTWNVNPANFENTMTLTGKLTTKGQLSSDIYDKIGVFVGSELRGVGDIQLYEELIALPNTHAYLVHLTVYSNMQSGETLKFKVWDASECAEWGDITETYTFLNDNALGTPTNPVTITATENILASIPWSQGWTWTSLNLQNSSSMSLNDLTSGVSFVSGDQIKTHTGVYATYNPSTAWTGTLSEFDNKTMYQVKLANAKNLEMVGSAVNPELTPIDIVSGWNGVGYTPQRSYPIDWALKDLSTIFPPETNIIAQTGDIVKSQDSYATYVENIGWVGPLLYLDPNKGYKLKLNKQSFTGTFKYPFFQPPYRDNVDETLFEPMLVESSPNWIVTPSAFEYNMNITGQLFTHDSISSDPYDMIGAFVGDECRGVAQPVYIEALDSYLVFMTIFSSGNSDETIHFKVYNADADELLFVSDFLEFSPNEIVGSIENPYQWNSTYLSIGDPNYIPVEFSLAQNFPNPFNPVTNIGFGLPEASDVEITIYNVMGQKVSTLVNEYKEAGYYRVKWNSLNESGQKVSAGLYLYQIRAKNYVQTRKLILLK